MIAIDLSKQQVLDDDLEAIQIFVKIFTKQKTQECFQY